MEEMEYELITTPVAVPPRPVCDACEKALTELWALHDGWVLCDECARWRPDPETAVFFLAPE